PFRGAAEVRVVFSLDGSGCEVLVDGQPLANHRPPAPVVSSRPIAPFVPLERRVPLPMPTSGESPGVTKIIVVATVALLLLALIAGIGQYVSKRPRAVASDAPLDARYATPNGIMVVHYPASFTAKPTH